MFGNKGKHLNKESKKIVKNTQKNGIINTTFSIFILNISGIHTPNKKQWWN